MFGLYFEIENVEINTKHVENQFGKKTQNIMIFHCKIEKGLKRFGWVLAAWADASEQKGTRAASDRKATAPRPEGAKKGPALPNRNFAFTHSSVGQKKLTTWSLLVFENQKISCAQNI